MATPREAVAELRSAIAAMRSAAGGQGARTQGGAKELLELLSQVEEKVKEVSYQDDSLTESRPDPPKEPKQASAGGTPGVIVNVVLQDVPRREQPQSLRAASEATRRAFAKARSKRD